MNFNQIKSAIESNDIVYVAEVTEDTDIMVKSIRVVGLHWDSIAKKHYAVSMSGRQYDIDDVSTNENSAKNNFKGKLISDYAQKLAKLQAMD